MTAPDNDLIVRTPGVLGGKPRIAGTRISVEFILELFATGGSVDTICAQWPQLTPAAVAAALRHAASVVGEEQTWDIPTVA